jgi:hypothetical protein
MMRPTMSAPPPGPNATTMRMLRAGHSCAVAGAASWHASAQASKIATIVLFMAALLLTPPIVSKSKLPPQWPLPQSGCEKVRDKRKSPGSGNPPGLLVMLASLGRRFATPRS